MAQIEKEVKISNFSHHVFARLDKNNYLCAHKTRNMVP